MGIYQKENNDLILNGGLGIIDKILNKFSNHAVSNKVMSEELERINLYFVDKIEDISQT